MQQTTIYDFIVDDTEFTAPLIPMSEDETQEQWVKKNLEKRGFITRNECLGLYITRLAARIRTLKEKGMDIKSENLKTNHGIDHVYYL